LGSIRSAQYVDELLRPSHTRVEGEDADLGGDVSAEHDVDNREVGERRQMEYAGFVAVLELPLIR
jgi:hypothetical protein